MFRKHSPQHIDLSGDLLDFNFISLLEPVNSSFYLSIGISILETLIRLKSCPELTHNTWVSLFESLSKTKKAAESWLLVEKHQDFKKIAEKINNSDRNQGLKLIKKILSSPSSLLSIDYSMRLILHLIYDSDLELVLNNSFQDYLSLCKGLPDLLNIGVGLGRGNQLKHFISKTPSPMIFVYQVKKSQFCLLYHKACKYIDEKQDLTYTDCSVYPFTSKGLKVRPSQKLNQTISNNSEVFDLIKLLSENLKNNLKDSTKSKILHKVHQVSNFFPQLSDVSVFSDMGKKAKNESFYEKNAKVRSPALTSSFGYKTDFNDLSLIRNKTFSTGTRKVKKRESLEYYSKLCRNNMELYKTCRYCKKVVNCSDFSLISCENHTICLQCRTRSYKKGKYSCPECDRSYNIREHNLLKINDSFKSYS